jgi:hypothetical protein
MAPPTVSALLRLAENDRHVFDTRRSHTLM